MKKNAVALIAAVVAIGVAAAALWLALSSEPIRDVRKQPTGAATPQQSAQPAEVAANSDPTTLPAIPASNDANAREVPRTQIDPANLETIEGFVQLPPATPKDEQLEVLAFAKTDDPSSETADWTIADIAKAEERDLVARAKVGADGKFRCSVPKDRGPIWCVLSGRYLYCTGQRVDPTAAREVRFEPELGTWITGSVLSPPDAPDGGPKFGEQRIELTFDPLRSFNTITGGSEQRLHNRKVEPSEERTFEFRAVIADTEYDLRARPRNLAALKTSRFPTAPGQHAVVDLPLALGGTLAGRIHDEQGKAIGGAKIEATIDPLVFGQGGFDVREGHSESDGSFELKAVAAGKVQLRFSSDGFIELTRNVDVADRQTAGDLDITLTGGNSIAGTVKWSDGAPAAEVEINVNFDMSQMAGMGAFNAMKGARGKGKSDGAGNFVVRGLGAGPFTVKVESRARDATETPKANDLWRARADGVKPGTADLALVLAAPQGIDGRVVDRGDKPIAKFKVAAQRVSGGMLPGLDSDRVEDSFTDDNGAFTLRGLGAGKWEVNAIAEGFAPGTPVPFVLPRAEGEAPLTLTLSRVASISGVVLGIGGSPASEAEVRVKLGLSDVMRAGREERKPPTARTDSEGKFKLEGLTPGTVAIVAKAEETADSEPASFDVAEGQAVTDATLRLREGGLLTGELFGKDGKPLASASVMTNMTSDPLAQRWSTSDAEGHFRIEHMSPGNWNVIHLPMGARSKDADGAAAGAGSGGDDPQADALAMFADMQMTTADMLDGKETHVVLGAPPKNPVHVHGRALLDGRGVANVLITFVADGGKGMDSMRFLTSGADGSYSVQLNQPGGYLASVQRAGTSGQQQTHSTFIKVPEVEDFEHDIALPVGGISGVVRDAEGSPAPNVRVTLMEEGAVPNGSIFGEQFAEIATDERGAYELIWLEHGTYSVAVGGSAFGGLFGTSSDARGRQVRSGLELSEGEWMRNIDFKLREPGAIHGVVHGADGKPVAKAAIFVRDGQGRLLERLSMTQTDANGRFECGAIDPGDYSLFARTAAEVTSSTVATRVREKETSEIELRLASGTILIVTMTNDEGADIDCSVKVVDDAGHQVNGMMSLEEIMAAFSQGRFSTKEQRVGPLPPGKYLVTATTKDGKTINKPVTLSGQAERKLTLKL